MRRAVIWLLLCCILGTCNAAVNMKFNGEVEAEFQYTPENSWIGWDSIWCKSIIDTGSPAAVFISFGERSSECGEKINWWDTQPRRFGFFVDKVYLTYTGPLYNNASESVLTIGDLSLVYHPYFLKLDYWDEGNYLEREYDQSKRGIALDDFKLGQLNFSSFYLWDGNDNIDKYAYGLKGKKEFPTGDIEAMFISFLDNKQGSQAPTIKQKFSQDTYGLIIKKELNKSLLFNGVFGCMGQSELKESGDEIEDEYITSRLLDVYLKYSINNQLFLSGNYVDFPKSFDPVYRDRTPKYHPITNRRLSWNNLDRFSDLKGIKISIEHLTDQNKLVAQYSDLRDHNFEHPERIKSLTISGKFFIPGNGAFSFWKRSENTQFIRAGQLINEQLYLSSKYGLSFPIAKSKMFIGYNLAKRSSFSKTVDQEIYIANVATDCLLIGLDYRFGFKQSMPESNSLYPFFELNGKTPLGIELTMRWSKYNRQENFEYEYDEDDNIILIDNLFKVGAKLAF